eukprot:CAMPEP_0119343530 /NCGR_PEP_ID=MMETSP1333-20130426/106494_1 /TAXON_ID=418940 /ORGANISM="Scyphosphaera apsteinii, Strain RCC1455" /LENGTH=143 /DNA_ID=CAMNT_0007355925 /DNA_START=99 /DNA_END=530 /DNA_ORIENTATION=+
MLSLAVLAADAFVAPQSRLPASQGTRSAQAISMLKPVEAIRKLPAAATALGISTYAQVASAKSVVGVNGALDFGNLASGVGGEGTGKALGVNDDSLFVVLGLVTIGIGLLFAQWQEYQDDDDDYFDTYDSRRVDRVLTNRNRV